MRATCAALGRGLEVAAIACALIEFAPIGGETTGLRVRGDRFYFNLGDQQSDLWMAEIAGSR